MGLMTETQNTTNMKTNIKLHAIKVDELPSVNNDDGRFNIYKFTDLPAGMEMLDGIQTSAEGMMQLAGEQDVAHVEFHNGGAA